jgi:hypothetical protein
MRQPLGFTREAKEQTGKLWITVVFTNAERTRAALAAALNLSHHLNAFVEVVVMRVVPYPLPLDQPPVPQEFTKKHVMEQTGIAEEKTAICIYDCRDAEEALLQVLQPNSVVIIGSRKAWWPTREDRLARKLRQAGHDVVLTGTRSLLRK